MRLTRPAIVLAGALMAVLLAVAPARAEGEAVTEVAIRPLDPVTIGSAVTVMVDLHLEGGAPVPSAPIALTIRGQPLRVIQTDAAGAAAFRLTQDLAPGEYPLVATYAGATGAFLGGSDELVLSVVPFELAVETVPALPGMGFTLDGKPFTAGADGIARLPVAVVGDYQLSVLDDGYRGDGQRAEFSGWSTGADGRQVVIHIPLARPFQAGFDIHLPASQSFVDVDGGAVDPARVTSITLRSSLGEVSTYPDGRQRLLKANRALRGPRGLESVAVRYDVEAVEVDGSNVVNAGQLSFGFGGDEPWEIKLTLFSAQIQPRDALFGFTAGRLVDISYPDGTTIRIETDVDGQLAVPSLARSTYRMTVADAPGWAPVASVAVSPGHEVVLRVVTYLDMLVAALVATGLALWLLRIERPDLLTSTLRRTARRPLAVAHQQARPASRFPLLLGTLMAAEGSGGNYLAAIPHIVPAAMLDFPHVPVRVSSAADSGAPAPLRGVVSPALRRRRHIHTFGAPSVTGFGGARRFRAAEPAQTPRPDGDPTTAATTRPKTRVTRQAKTNAAADAPLDQAKSAAPKARGGRGRAQAPVEQQPARQSKAVRSKTKARPTAKGTLNAKAKLTAKTKAKAKAAPSAVTTNRADSGKRTGKRTDRGARTNVQPRIEAGPSPTDATGTETADARHDLRLAQLQALGIDDPGEGPIALRERWTFVPEASPDSTPMRDLENCAQCGFPVWPDAPLCPRCGYRQADSSAAPPVRGDSPSAPQGAPTRAGVPAMPGTRGKPRPPKAT